MALQTSGEIKLSEIASEFDDAVPNGMSEFYGAAAGIPASGEITISDFYGASAVVVPSGLIVPLYNTSTVPTGWSRFTAADGKTIVAAGSTYTAGASSAGTGTIPYSGSTSNSGAHAGPGNTGCGGGGGGVQGNLTVGGHSHTFSGSYPSVAEYKNFVLIKADSDQDQLPTNAMMFGTTSLSGLTNVETSVNRLLQGASSYGGTGGANSGTFPISFSSVGSHNHTGNVGGGDPSGGPCTNRSGNTGAHTHPGTTAPYSIGVARMYLSCWTNASASFDLVANGIAMWESGTPPDGWYVCDGANGTVDLRNYFLTIGNTGNHGTKSGSNTYSGGISSFSGTAPHNHDSGGFSGNGVTTTRHNSWDWPHSHTMSSGSGTAYQPYYALTFIQFGG